MRAIALPPRGIGARLEERLGFGPAAGGATRAERRGAGLQRERHAPEYGMLVAIVALAAIGILMVYSSSALRAYLQEEDPFAVVGPQLLWATLGLGTMAVAMRIDYRWIRLVSLPVFLVAVVLLVLVLLPPTGPFKPIVIGGSARWLTLGPLPAIHPAEFAKLAL
ncbi:MAG TPA: FtsW/RodA/SpoVE family cell cycle protein, partial [Candidatus Limnocylindrales bacterium]|nr:FtsW/RodA/SpoVE family cell cycle protein [Candidatus Limnocylindrales bacterium]